MSLYNLNNKILKSVLSEGTELNERFFTKKKALPILNTLLFISCFYNIIFHKVISVKGIIIWLIVKKKQGLF